MTGVQIDTVQDLVDVCGHCGNLTNEAFFDIWKRNWKVNYHRDDLNNLTKLEGKYRGGAVVIVAAGPVPDWLHTLDVPMLVCSRALENGFPRADMVFAYDPNNKFVSRDVPLISNALMNPKFFDQYEGDIYCSVPFKTDKFRHVVAGGNVISLMMLIASCVFDAKTIIFAGLDCAKELHPMRPNEHFPDMEIYNFEYEGKNYVIPLAYYVFQRWMEIHAQHKAFGDCRWICVDDDGLFGIHRGEPVKNIERLNEKEIKECLQERAA